MQGRIWNGTHRNSVELVFGSFRLGGVCISAGALGFILAGITFARASSWFGFLAGVVILFITAVVVARLCWWFQRLEPSFTRSELSILATIITGSRTRTWNNLDNHMED